VVADTQLGADRAGSYWSFYEMRFELIDRIVELQPGARIKAVKNLSLAEEYLGDHFPNFPVMPGVLMLEALTQAGAWLIRATEDFAHSMIRLSEATNLRYGQFVQPGNTLTVTTEIISMSGGEVKLKAQGTVDGRLTVSARLVLTRYNLADRNSNDADLDRKTVEELRRRFQLIYPQGKAASA
jgi:3-hydroxyacyl-[acyl-carrier-protein] dehydratase